jgi:aspartyl-tRNA(Asn)/glutamyl-tRNA(Gln) amidotransferase subunit A
MLAVIEGPDARDPISAPMPPNDAPPNSLEGLRFGVPDAAALADCEDVVISAFEAFKSALTDTGAVLEPVEVAGWVPGKLRRAGLLICEVEGAEVFGDVLDGPGVSDSFKAMLEYGRRAGTGPLAQAYRLVQELAVSFDHAIAGCDGLLLPTAPQRAFAHGGAVPANQADFTALANVSGAPALTLPLNAPDDGLPGAAQIIGRKGSDHSLIAMGALMQELPPVRRTI